MKSKKVLSQKQLPIRSPIWGCIVYWLLLDRLDAAGWVWGVAGTLLAVLVISWVCSLFMYDSVEIEELK